MHVILIKKLFDNKDSPNSLIYVILILKNLNLTKALKRKLILWEQKKRWLGVEVFLLMI
jgi:hypothetical protein